MGGLHKSLHLAKNVPLIQTHLCLLTEEALPQLHGPRLSSQQATALGIPSLPNCHV